MMKLKPTMNEISTLLSVTKLLTELIQLQPHSDKGQKLEHDRDTLIQMHIKLIHIRAQGLLDYSVTL